MTTTAVMQNQSVPQSSQISNLSPNEFDYTFTDKELQDILGFMEHQAGGQDAAATSVPPPFLSAPPPSSLGLQFQPHPAPVQSGSTVAALPYDQNSTAGVKGEVASSSNGFVPTFGGTNGLHLAGGHPGTRSNAYHTNSMQLPDRRSSLQPIQGTATNRQDRGQKAASCNMLHCCFLYLQSPISCANAFAFCAEPRQHISHSTVEKQRRDRINSLIDEVCTVCHHCFA